MIDYSKLEKVHPYPAKYTIALIEEYVQKYIGAGSLILDPFMGSGTTALAARKYLCDFVGSDINPTAFLITKFKVTDFSNVRAKNLTAKEFHRTKISSDFKNNYFNIDHWFNEEVQDALWTILSKREKIKNLKYKTLYSLALSKILIWSSNQESDTRYAAVNKNRTFDEVVEKFVVEHNSLLKFMFKNSNEAYIALQDSKSFNFEMAAGRKADLLITSPPYINTYDYHLYHQHRNKWLGYDAKVIRDSEIGSRREFSSLKKSVDKFTEDIFEVFKNANHSLKKGAHIVVAIGDGVVDGEIKKADQLMDDVAKRLKWRKVESKYVELDKTSKSFSQNIRSKGKKEHWIVYAKN